MQRSALKIGIWVVTGLVIALVGVVVVISLASRPMNALEPRHPPARRPPSAAGSDERAGPSVDDILQSLPWGNIAFDAPYAMQYKKVEIIRLTLSPKESLRELQRRLAKSGHVEAARIHISDRMTATLGGDPKAFSITPMDPEVQAISRREPTSWAWLVTPEQYGTHWLYLTLSVHVNVAGSDTARSIRTFTRDIRVYVEIQQRVSEFIRQNWQWLCATLILPLLGVAWKLFRRRKKVPVRSGSTS